MRDHVLQISAPHVLEHRNHGGVATIDILADLQLAAVIHECGLVGDVDRDRRREFQVDLARAIHAADLLRRVALVRQGDVEQDGRVLIRILYPHAAVAEGAFFLGEQMLVRGVVLIDQELVGEVEADAPERVGFARRLRDVNRAVAALLQPQPHALQHGRVLLQRRQILVVDDRRRYVPGRIDRDELHGLAQQRRGVNARLSGHHAGGPDLRAMLHHFQRVVGNVEDDIGIADCGRTEVARQPAPALHVSDHDVDLLVALRAVQRPERAAVEHAGGLEVGAFLEFAHGFGDLGVVTGVVGVLRQAELGAQLRHARIFHHAFGLLLSAGRRVFQHRTIADLDHRSVALAAQFGELRLELLVELLRRVVAVERRGRIFRAGDVRQHFIGIDRVLGIGDVG